jgi:hypothetical protein
MKTSLQQILLTLVLGIVGSANCALAQEAGLPDVEINDTERERQERDKIIYSPGESDSRYVVRTSVPPKDTLASASEQSIQVVVPKEKNEKAAPAIKPAGDKPTKNEDDSILSFNFLYYIIEKYKLQDIVD